MDPNLAPKYQPGANDIPDESKVAEPIVSLDTQVVSDIVPTPDAPSTPVVQLAAKQSGKSLLWLWVTLSAVFIIVIGLIVGYVVVKGAGDSAAKTYNSAALTYVDDIYDAATTASKSPNDIVSEIEKVYKPSLEEVFLSDLSSDYKDAVELSVYIEKRVDKTKNSLEQYGTVYDLYNNLLDAEDAIDQTANTADKLATTMITYLQTVKKVVNDNTNVPNDLKSYLADFSSATSDLKDVYTEVLSAYHVKSQSRYDAAVARIQLKTTTYQTAMSKIDTYYKNLAEKISTVTKDLKSFVDGVK